MSAFRSLSVTTSIPPASSMRIIMEVPDLGSPDTMVMGLSDTSEKSSPQRPTADAMRLFNFTIMSVRRSDVKSEARRSVDCSVSVSMADGHSRGSPCGPLGLCR